ncbi:MAG: hypothetical protein P8Y42_20880 [Exilibacterium sp.]
MYNLDILIKAGFGHLQGEILNTAKYGIWAHYHADTQRFRGSPFCFWEVMEGEPATGAVLEILSNRPGAGQVLCRSWTTTHEQSPYINRNYCHWLATAFLSRQIERLHTVGEELFFREVAATNATNGTYCHRHYQTPNTVQTIALATKYCYKFFKSSLTERLYWDQWYLLYNIDKENECDIGRYKKIPLPKYEFWADPHIIERNGKYYIFFEKYIKSVRKGHLEVLQIDRQGNISAPATVLRKNYHLSYPLLVEYRDNLYMIPETKENSTVEIYRCKEFPHKWEFTMNLMNNVKAVDTTPLFHNDKWWLFTVMVDTIGTRCRENLYIFYADDLLTHEWQPHPMNPVKTDTRSARPAGRFFRKNNKLYRPSQDCSKRYGFGIHFNEIVRLSETEFEERVTWSILPNWEKGVVGVHSFAQEGDLTVVDAIKRRSNF